MGHDCRNHFEMVQNFLMQTGRTDDINLRRTYRGNKKILLGYRDVLVQRFKFFDKFLAVLISYFRERKFGGYIPDRYFMYEWLPLFKFPTKAGKRNYYARNSHGFFRKFLYLFLDQVGITRHIHK